jgi:S1-C subfamily serine protease
MLLVAIGCSKQIQPRVPLSQIQIEAESSSIAAAADDCSILESTVSISTSGIFRSWIGSGVVVGDGTLVLTAWHVTVNDDSGYYTVDTISCVGSEREYVSAGKAQLVAAFQDDDIAILKLESRHKPIPYRVSELELNETVRLFGNKSLGKIGRYNDHNTVSGLCRRGDSGGAVVDSSGYLVGIAISASSVKTLTYDNDLFESYKYVPSGFILYRLGLGSRSKSNASAMNIAL